MSAAMAREERHFSAFQHSQHIPVGWIAKRSCLSHLARRGQSWHGIQATAANDADFCLLQRLLLEIFYTTRQNLTGVNGIGCVREDGELYKTAIKGLGQI